MNWSDPETWKKHCTDPSVWVPVAYYSQEEKEMASNIMDIADDYIGGDRHGNIRNADTISRDLIRRAIRERYNEKTRNALDQMLQFIIRSNNPAAIALFYRFEKELSDLQPNKIILKGLWEGIEKVLPSVTSLSDSHTQVCSLCG